MNFLPSNRMDSPRSLANTRFASNKEQHKAHNVPYRAAILNAIESLHDFHTRSSTEAIRKYVQSSLPENVAWNSTLFYRTLKDTIQHGDLEQSNASCKLSQELKRKRAEEIATLLTRKLNTYPPPDIQLKYEQKGVPRRHCLHAKPKITPQRILDKAIIRNPMEMV